MRTNLLAVALLVATLFTACNSAPATEKSETAPNTDQVVQSASDLEVIQFHSEHRCMTCNKIESMTITALESFDEVPFRLVNVDDETNAEMAREFEAAGTALFLYNSETGKKKDLTDFAFMTAHDEEKFIAELKNHIAAF